MPMYVAKGNSFLTDISLRKIEIAYHQESHAKAKIRLQCAVLRKKGRSIPFISEVVGKRTSSVSDILRRFEERGMAGCHAIKQKGQKPKLSPQQRLKLKKAIDRSPQAQGIPCVIWTTKLIQKFIEKTFGVEYVHRHVRDLVTSLGLSIQKPRPEHIRANKKLQAQFKKNFDEELKKSCKQDMRSPFWMKASSP